MGCSPYGQKEFKLINRLFVEVSSFMRILLAEDEKKVADIIVRGLKAERYAVDVHHDGQSAWEAASTYDYDLIILDLMLPGLTGTEILEKVRRKNQHVPILILTARDSVADKIKNFETGADDYLTKPFAFAELQVRIKALLRRGRGYRNLTYLLLKAQRLAATRTQLVAFQKAA